MKKSLAIIGAGAWGSALAIALSKEFEKIFLITKDKANTKGLGNQHEALSVPFNSNISIGNSFEVIEESQAVLIATPSSSFNSVLKNLSPHVKSKPIAWVTKGFDPAYTNCDIVGVQVGGSVKNILAIAAGIANGLGFGANTQAALITRGLAEMTRLGEALGADKVTFQGLSGMGDLVLTCSDDLSRNRRFGKELANNISTEKALKNINATVEGFKALQLVIMIANNHQIEMPICEQVLAVTEGRTTPREAVNELLLRKPSEE